MKKIEAMEKLCPFTFNNESCPCGTNRCMAWVVEQIIDEDDDALGHCELIHKK